MSTILPALMETAGLDETGDRRLGKKAEAMMGRVDHLIGFPEKPMAKTSWSVGQVTPKSVPSRHGRIWRHAVVGVRQTPMARRERPLFGAVRSVVAWRLVRSPAEAGLRLLRPLRGSDFPLIYCDVTRCAHCIWEESWGKSGEESSMP